MRQRVQLIGGPADGRVVSVDTDLEVWEVIGDLLKRGLPEDGPTNVEFQVERYNRHEVIVGSGWGPPRYVYAHHLLTAADVTERLNEQL